MWRRPTLLRPLPRINSHLGRFQIPPVSLWKSEKTHCPERSPRLQHTSRLGEYRYTRTCVDPDLSVQQLP